MIFGAWPVTRYADARTPLADPRISPDSAHPHFSHTGAGQKERRTPARTSLSMDGSRARRPAPGALEDIGIGGVTIAAGEVRPARGGCDRLAAAPATPAT
ncbi:hypothetical protein ACFC09_06990 [Streptomyces sp. NPDC056161]|uniref:hypothetical protein n=1 Tax=Streptomyces sp. NPDC056161 TaxID=3345732 RepID=UPI0035E2385F